jgi:hypothetical protein
MSGNEVKLTNGQRWRAQQFLDHYFEPSGSGTPVPVVGPPSPVAVDMPWYMSEGPGRFYHPGMFPIIEMIAKNRKLAPMRYNLLDFVPNRDPRDPSLTARILNYTTGSFPDYKTRALVFGDESARISGRVIVRPDGTKTFEKVEIKPWDTNFDFHNNNAGSHVELPRRIAREVYDPENQGVSYNIEYRGHGRLDEPGPDRGIGRIYHPFTDAQLSAARRKEFAYPGSTPPGLLPSYTAAPPPAINEHLQYLDQASGNRALAAAPGPGGRASNSASSVNRNSLPSSVGNWVASLAGVDPTDPTQPQQGGSFGSNSP